MSKPPAPPELPRELDVLIETPRGSAVKRRSDGSVDYVSPVPSPFNYGCAPDHASGDGDPLDVVVLGPRLPRGARLRVPVVGVMGFLDAGFEDPKVICSARPFGRWQLLQVEWFFWLYTFAKRFIHLMRRERGETRCLGWLTPPRISAERESR